MADEGALDVELDVIADHARRQQRIACFVVQQACAVGALLCGDTFLGFLHGHFPREDGMQGEDGRDLLHAGQKREMLFHEGSPLENGLPHLLRAWKPRTGW